MARNLMMMIGLSLAVVALGCADGGDGTGDGGGGGDAGSGGTAGNGGTAGSGGGQGGTGGAPVTDACTNSDDLSMVCLPDFGDDYVVTCALAATGGAEATSACLQEEPPGLSADCADCFGAQVGCVVDECTLGGDGSCLPPDFGGDFGPGTPECDACIAASGCPESFDSCGGDLSTACVG